MAVMTAKELVAALRKANENPDKKDYYELLTSQLTTLIAEAKPLFIKALQIHTTLDVKNNISDDNLIKILTTAIVNGDVKAIAVIIDLSVKLKEIHEGIRDKNGDMITKDSHSNVAGSGAYDGSGIAGGLTNDLHKLGLPSPFAISKTAPTTTASTTDVAASTENNSGSGALSEVKKIEATFTDKVKKNKMPIIIGTVAVILLATGIGYAYMHKKGKK